MKKLKKAYLILLTLWSGLISSVGSTEPQQGMEFKNVPETFTPQKLEQLKVHANLAMDFWKSIAKRPSGKLTFDFARTSMSPGYSLTKKRIMMPNSKKYLDRGIHSKDFVTHEAFHAMFCEAAPQYCIKDLSNIKQGDEDLVQFHEALADYFSASLEGDGIFGNGLYAAKENERPLINQFCYSLFDPWMTHLRQVSWVSWWTNEKIAPEKLFMAALHGTNPNLVTLSESLGLKLPTCMSQDPPKISFEGKSKSNRILRNQFRIKPGKSIEVKIQSNSIFDQKFLSAEFKILTKREAGAQESDCIAIQLVDKKVLKITTKDCFRGVHSIYLRVFNQEQWIGQFAVYFTPLKGQK